MRVENVKGAVWTVDEVEFYKRRPQRACSTTGYVSPDTRVYLFSIYFFYPISLYLSISLYIYTLYINISISIYIYSLKKNSIYSSLYTTFTSQQSDLHQTPSKNLSHIPSTFLATIFYIKIFYIFHNIYIIYIHVCYYHKLLQSPALPPAYCQYFTYLFYVYRYIYIYAFHTTIFLILSSSL